MKETLLTAVKRTDKLQKIRKAGMVPGILNTEGTTSIPVQFEATALEKVILKHGAHAKVWISLDGDKKFGFIKEIQISPVERKVVHVAVKLVTSDQEIKMQLPISYHGKEHLESRLLQLQIFKSEIDVVGKTALMPDVLIVDVSGRNLGDVLTVTDLNLPEGLKFHDETHETYAVIRAVRSALPEVDAEAEATV